MPYHPKLLATLHDLHKQVDVKFPAEYVDEGFGTVGLILTDELVNYGYDETPKNSLAFATTGVDGIHYSFLVNEGGVTDDSPIVMTIPGEENSNCIVGDNLRDFLSLGCRYGYEVLCNLLFDRDSTLELVGNVSDSHDERCRAILDFLTTSLELKPWSNPSAHFNDLQSKYAAGIAIDTDP